jgi:wyosine [tRNA(Phe)-imidazoG37] synthetase (radical SAM superfamily)
MKNFEPIVYGPVQSRRLGRSLGLDLTPVGCRVCNFDCLYCVYPRRPERRGRPRWPTPEEVTTSLREALLRTGFVDSITISGHGEPTLHPRFLEVVDAILAVARRLRPSVAVRILTNGSRAVLPEVRTALDLLDERIVKLDAEPERMSGQGAGYGAILFGLLGLQDVTLQSCFVEGSGSNTNEECIDEWTEIVAEMRPRGMQIYTIDREPADGDARPVKETHLALIARRLKQRTGIEADGAWPRARSSGGSPTGLAPIVRV